MPGKKPSDASWRWASQLKGYRQVAAADANLAAVTEVIDMSKPEDADVRELQQGYDNVLYLGFLFPVGVTSITAKVFVESTPVDNDDLPTPLTGDQYALIHEETFAEPSLPRDHGPLPRRDQRLL
jgi:hypothetical protein